MTTKNTSAGFERLFATMAMAEERRLTECLRDPYFAAQVEAAEACGDLKALLEEEAPTMDLKDALAAVTLALAKVEATRPRADTKAARLTR